MSATRYLIFALVTALFATTSRSEWISCNFPTTFSIKVNDDKKLFVHEAEIGVKYERRELAVYEHPDTNIVNILINNTAVSFTGHVTEEDQKYEFNSFKTGRILNIKIAGSARLTRNTYNYETLTDCDLYLSRTLGEDGEDLPSTLQLEILYQAESCVRSAVCQRLGKVTINDLRNAKLNPYGFGPLAVTLIRNVDDKSSTNVESHNNDKVRNTDHLTSIVSSAEQLGLNDINKNGLQSTINILVDLAIAEVIRKMREENQGRIKIPDLNHEIAKDSLWKPHGMFTATNGTFSDLTTLSRTEDATLSHKGLKFIASCGFGLSKANINYEKYKLKYSIMPSVRGHLSASIDGVAIAISVAVDYNQKPCQAILQDLRITKLGNINLKITGLGDLINKFMSKIVTWVTKKWKDEIVKQVEEKVKTIIAKHMASFNCEKYRP